MNTTSAKNRLIQRGSEDLIDLVKTSYHGNFEKLRQDLLANRLLAEFESQLSKILGTEVVSATCGNGSYFIPVPRSEFEPIPSPPPLSPFLLHISMEQIMDMRDARAYRSLVEVLRVKNEELRVAAAKALADIQYEVPRSSIGAELMLLMDDPDPSVRKAAVQARSEILDTNTVSLVLRALNDADEEVRNVAKEALPKAASIYKILSKEEGDVIKSNNDMMRIIDQMHSDEPLVVTLGAATGDILKSEDRYGHIVYIMVEGPTQPRSIPLEKVWRTY